MGHKFAYPSGLSSALAGNLSAAASGAETFGGQMSTGMGTLSTVISDVSAVMNEINTHLSGQSITAMAGFWDGQGAIGSGGLNSGGVISDGSKAMSFLDSLSGCMPGVSGGLSDQVSTIKSGLSAISTIQASPHKEWKAEEINTLQGQIDSMVSALTAVNSTLLSTASAIQSAASSVKLGPGVACASGVSVGEQPDGQSFSLADQVWLIGQGIDPYNSGSGKPPETATGGGGKKPPTGGSKPPAAGDSDPWWSKFLRKGPDGKWRFIPGDAWRTAKIPQTVANLINALVSGGINYAVPTFLVNAWATSTEGILLGLGGGFVAMLAGSAFSVPELWLVATGASAFTAAGGALILHFAGVGKKSGSGTTVTITPVTDGKYKGDYKVQYQGKTYYMPPSQLQPWLQQHHLAPKGTPSSSPKPKSTQKSITVSPPPGPYPTQLPSWLQQQPLAPATPTPTPTR